MSGGGAEGAREGEEQGKQEGDGGRLKGKKQPPHGARGRGTLRG